jgi:hypothetical protein
MAKPSLPNDSYKVTYRIISWRDEAIRAWGEAWSENDHAIYEWSNGREFDSTDKGVTGIYASRRTSTDGLILENHYPDAPAHLLQRNGFKILIQQ